MENIEIDELVERRSIGMAFIPADVMRQIAAVMILAEHKLSGFEGTEIERAAIERALARLRKVEK